MYAIEREVQRDTKAVLEDWATVERYLKLVAPNSPEADALFAESRPCATNTCGWPMKAGA